MKLKYIELGTISSIMDGHYHGHGRFPFVLLHFEQTSAFSAVVANGWDAVVFVSSTATTSHECFCASCSCLAPHLTRFWMFHSSSIPKKCSYYFSIPIRNSLPQSKLYWQCDQQLVQATGAWFCSMDRIISRTQLQTKLVKVGRMHLWGCIHLYMVRNWFWLKPVKTSLFFPSVNMPLFHTVAKHILPCTQSTLHPNSHYFTTTDCASYL